jgi:hypothetical protein
MCADSTEGVTYIFMLNYFEDMGVPFLQSQEIPDNHLPQGSLLHHYAET